ncbi:hypothetical protein JVU11DRAFT_6111 [Chiua virens]|nr:hypothetical protein JVU11DRAFT_6111 [Chiua virens]
MPATQIPEYLFVPAPALQSFERHVAQPSEERALNMTSADIVPTFHECENALREQVDALKRLQDEARTLQDRERALKELSDALQARERALKERERAFQLQQQRPLEPVNLYGFPRPGEQSPTPAEATGKHYFVDETNWKQILQYGEFDDIVCGSGFCALAYIEQALKLDPFRKILVLERGGFWLPAHFQNLPLPFNLLLGGESETFPWSLTSTTWNGDIQFMRGSCPFFGGRSLFWSAWCPRPPLELMRDFPQSLIDTATPDEFWTDSQELLHVVKATDLHNAEYQILQEYIDSQLADAVKNKTIETADYSETSHLAVGKTTALSTLVFEKFAIPGPLLDVYERQRQLAKIGKGSPLKVALDVVVKKFDIDSDDIEKKANVLYTSKGDLCFSRKKPNIILATGAIPACTIVQNSIPEQRQRAGSRLSGHFLTHIVARFPIPENVRGQLEDRKNRSSDDLDHLELAGSYLAGHDPNTNLQYHADITTIHSPDPVNDAADAARLCPDYFSAPSMAQLDGSENYIIVACVMLGEIDETNEECWVHPNLDNPDVTTNIRLQSHSRRGTRQRCHVSCAIRLQAIDAMAGVEKANLQYWHENGDGGKWEESQPDLSKFLMAGIVHESSTLYMSDQINQDATASIDSNYKVFGSGNVFATGASIFPTSGSWNPTLTMCGYAQDLAKKLAGPVNPYGYRSI